jgi:MFS family permease
MTVIPVFLTEISDDKVRGRIGSIFAIAFNVGILVGYVTGSYLSYFQFPWVPIALITIFLIAFSFVAESPTYLLSKNKLTVRKHSYLSLLSR